MANEGHFQNKILKPAIRERFPGCKIHKMEGEQGMPDLLILYNKNWALLEAKDSADAKHQPNQDFWVTYFNRLSFSAFVYPENMEEVLDEMEHTFSS